MKGKIIITVVFISILFSYLYTGLYYHEQVHGVTCEHFGGTAVYNYSLTKATTSCENITYSSDSEYNTKRALDIQNEIITYNIMDVKSFLFTITLVLFLMLLFIYDIRNDYRFLARMKYEEKKGGKKHE